MSWRCGRHPGEEEAARQGGGGRGTWPRAPGACPCPSGEGGRRQGGGEAAVGWAAGGAGPAGLPGERQVVFSPLCFSYFCFLLF